VEEASARSLAQQSHHAREVLCVCESFSEALLERIQGKLDLCFTLCCPGQHEEGTPAHWRCWVAKESREAADGTEEEPRRQTPGHLQCCFSHSPITVGERANDSNSVMPQHLRAKTRHLLEHVEAKAGTLFA